jgi:hypothetical protein
VTSVLIFLFKKIQLCSAAGIYVAQIGLNAARTIDLDSIRKYLRWLTALAVACTVMRIAWIFDIVLQIQDAVDKAKNNPTDGSDTGILRIYTQILYIYIYIYMYICRCIYTYIDALYQ